MRHVTKAGMSGLFILAVAASPGWAAGILTPKGSPNAPIQIRSHDVNVVINNGFARTEVIQTFYNPNDADLEAIYSFPVPKTASLSEVTIYIGEKEIHGEVLEKLQARQVYEQEKCRGNEAGLAEKNSYLDYQFAVSPVRARSETRLRFVYYQPLEIDTGVGRYLYPVEEGGTDEVAPMFWVPNRKVEGTFSVNLELKSAWPVADVRVPGTGANVRKIDEGHYKVRLEAQNASLSKDFVFYYRLQDNLPGRVELMAYRDDETKPGTFMMVVTPGLDLKPLVNGADYTFVLDVSGSMAGKIQSLAKGVVKALGEFRPLDRFRIITFETRATELTNGWQAATPENVRQAIRSVQQLTTLGSTNLYDGVAMALKGLDADRATSIVLVTDAVTNTGVVAPDAFHKLMKQYDVRVFGFLMGNSGNWPLMRTICGATGGFYAGVSNSDDIVGQILLAKSKITNECLHDASFKIRGVKVFDGTDELLGKVYRGQQLVIFGRYDKGGQATVELKASLTGEDKTYATTFDFPDLDRDNPEIERLWAMNRIEDLEQKMNSGLMPEKEGEMAIQGLGVDYQLVTDYTSMVVLSDAVFSERGIRRMNQERVARENQAQATRAAQPARNHRVDQKRPAFNHRAPSLGGGGGGGGGGAIDPITGGVAVGLALLAVVARRRRGQREGEGR